MEQVELFSSQSLRTLCLAYRELNGNEDLEK